jgi:hypothetical protein
MAKENQIADIINASVKAVLKDARFVGAQYSGITVLLPEGNIIQPCTTDDSGDAKIVGINNTHPLQAYHRNNGSSFSIAPDKQFGDGVTRNQITSMSLFVIAQRSRIKMTPEDLLLLVASGIPGELTQAQRETLKLKGCTISLQSVDVNAQNIFKREYQIQKPLDPQVIMFELKYQIECSFSNACINTLCC